MLDDVLWGGAWDSKDHIVGIGSRMYLSTAFEGSFLVDYEEVHGSSDLVGA